MPNCYECHVEIDKVWYDHIDMTMYEDMGMAMEEQFYRSPQSRLACCITVQPWMKEMRLRLGDVLEADTNDYRDVPWFKS